MAANNQDSTDNAFAPQEYSRGYILIIKFIINNEKEYKYDSKKDWLLQAEFRCHDLLHVMRHGLFWTTSNIVPERGYRYMTSIKADDRPLRRVWELREHADRPESQCRWTATFNLQAQSHKTLADFRLRAMRQENICSAVAWNTMNPPQVVFHYDHPRLTSVRQDINCWIDDLHPAHGSWWFFPMETVPDYDKINEGTVMEKGSLI